MPLTEKQISNLKADVKRARKQLEPFRRFRKEGVDQFVGAFYSDDGSDRPNPVNLIELGVMTYASLLVASNPAAMVTTKKVALKPTADDIQLAMDYQIQDIQLERTLERFVIDAMFSVGIIHCSLENNGQVEIDGELHDVGQSFVENIDLDDFVFDLNARRIDQCHFLGHRYEWRKDLLDGVPWVDKDKLKKLKPSGYQAYNEGGEERVSSISRGTEQPTDDRDSFYEMVSLWDIYVPMEHKIYTFAAEGHSASSSEALGLLIGERDWYGPECGPYHFLGFQHVPGQLMPLPPVATWRSLHDQANRAWRKLGWQNDREKTVALAAGSSTPDAENVMRLNDGEVGTCNDPNSVKEFHFGGVDQRSFAFAVDLIGRWSYIAGNIDSLGGLGAQSDTAKGEQLIGQSASRRMTFMSRQVNESVKGILRHMVWYLLYDPLISVPITKRVPGTEIEFESEFTPSQMEAEYLDFNFDIQPCSLKEQTPETRLNAVKMLMQEFIMPLAPQMEASGQSVNIPSIIKLVAKLIGTPDLDELIIKSPADRDREAGPVGDAPRKPANTTRQYERVSSGGPSRGGADQQLVQKMMSGAQQP